MYPVLILAGGLGTRIQQLTKNMPKSMVNVLGEPFIAHQLRLLKRNGIAEVILLVGHKAQPLVDFVGDGSKFGLKVTCCHDGEVMLGTGGALRKAQFDLEGPFAVLYGDSYSEQPIGPVFESFSRSQKEGLMTVFRNRNAIIPSNLLVVDNEVIRYDKNNPSADMEHVDYGLTVFSKRAFESEAIKTLSEGPFDMSALVVDLINRGQLASYDVPERFYEVGTPEGLAALEAHILQHSP